MRGKIVNGIICHAIKVILWGLFKKIGDDCYCHRKQASRCFSSAKYNVVRLEEAKRFLVDCMKALKTPLDQASQLADVLVEADYRGHYSHGLNRIGKTVSRGLLFLSLFQLVLLLQKYT